MEQWVLRALPDIGSDFNDGFYTGKSYVFQGSKYAVIEHEVQAAKKYSSYARALAAKNKFEFEYYSFEVVRFSEC